MEKHCEWSTITIMRSPSVIYRRNALALRFVSLLLTVSVFSSSPLFGDGDRSKFDFDPPPPAEAPLSSYLPDADANTGLIVSGLGTVCGISASLLIAGSAVNNGLDDSSGSAFQRDLTLMGSAIIGTAVFTVFFDYYLEQHRKKKRATSEE